MIQACQNGQLGSLILVQMEWKFQQGLTGVNRASISILGSNKLSSADELLRRMSSQNLRGIA